MIEFRLSLFGIVRAIGDRMHARIGLGRQFFGSAERYLGLGAWLFVSWVFFSIASQWVMFSSYDKTFTEYVQHVLQRAALEERSTRDIRTLVLVKAEQLSIPLEHESLDIRREGETVRTFIDYNTEIKIPLVNRVLYRMEFSHNLSNKVLP